MLLFHLKTDAYALSSVATNSQTDCHFPFAELPLTLVHPDVL